MRRIPIAVAVLALTLLTACSAKPATPSASTAPTPTPSAEPSTATTPPGPEQAMPLEERRKQLPEDFPIEVPVMNGKVVSAEKIDSPEGEIWRYELDPVDGANEIAWYKWAYSGREWRLVSGREVSPDGGPGSTRLLFKKGSAQSNITIEWDASGSRVMALIGFGVPLDEAQ